MAIMPDSSPFGSQTVTGPGWPNVDEEALSAAAMSYEQFATHITGQVVPQQQGQMMTLSDNWLGAGGTAAVGEASTIVGGHEANAAQAGAVALKLRSMEAAVVKAKAAANAVAEETQHECEAISAMPFGNSQELVQSRIKFGLSQNMTQVTAATTELADSLGVPPNLPQIGLPPAMPGGQEAAKKSEDAADKGAGQGMQQGMQMIGQMASMAGQLPQMAGQLPQQLSQPMQQLTQPLQQLTSMFSGLGKSDSAGLGSSGFSAFSKHPLAGGSGAGSGSGMTRAASLPGAGGSSPRTPLLSKMVGDNANPSATAVDQGAAGGAVAGGVAPVAAGAGGGMGGAGMMGQRGSSGGTTQGLSVPAPLEYDLAEDDVDDDW